MGAYGVRKNNAYHALVQQWDRQIKGIALVAWLKLSTQCRVFLDLEDLQQDAYLFIWKDVIPTYQKKKNVKISTYMVSTLNNHFADYLKHWMCDRRRPRYSYQLEDDDCSCEIEQEIIVKELYSRLYLKVWPETRRMLSGMVGVPEGWEERYRPRERVRKQGWKWFAVLEDLQVCASQMGIGYQDLTLAMKGQSNGTTMVAQA